MLIAMNQFRTLGLFFLIILLLSGCLQENYRTIIEFTGFYPTNGEVTTSKRPELSWDPVEEAAFYQLRLSKTDTFTEPMLISIDFLGTNNLPVYFDLAPGEYYWKIRAEVNDILTDWSPVYNFIIEEEHVLGGEVFKFNSTFDSKNIYSLFPQADSGILFAGYNNDGGETSMDLWFGKLSASGTLSWQYTLPQEEIQQFGSITLWNGNYVLAGAHSLFVYDSQMQPLLQTHYTFSSGSDNAGTMVRPIDTNTLFYLTHENSHRFAAAIIPNGDRQWARDISIGDRDYAEEALILSDGGIILAGKTDYVEGSFIYDGLLTRLNALGDKVWEFTYGQTGEEYFEDVIELSDGSLFLAGSTETAGAGGSDLWLLNIDASDGSIISQWTLGEGMNDYGRALLQESPGSVIIAGEKSLNSYQNTYLWLMELNLETGLFLWQKTIGEANTFSGITDLSSYSDGYIISAHDSLIKTNKTGDLGSLAVDTNIALVSVSIPSTATDSSSGTNTPGEATSVLIDLAIPDITLVKTTY